MATSTQKWVTPIVLYLRRAHLWHVQAGTDLSEELPKKRRRTEVFVSSNWRPCVPIGRHNFKYRRWFVPWVPSAPELCISVRQWPGRLGHRAHQSLDRRGTPRAGSRP